jgi:hypothetical protein
VTAGPRAVGGPPRRQRSSGKKGGGARRRGGRRAAAVQILVSARGAGKVGVAVQGRIYKEEGLW